MKKNLFSLPPFVENGVEQFETLLEQGDPALPGGFRLERIGSFGQATAHGEWYDQPWTEWVAVLRGRAVLAYDDGEAVALESGDYLILPPHRRHRVAQASDDCLWLAFHYNKG